MRYMLLIYRDDAAEPRPGDPAWLETMAGYGVYLQEVQQRGAFLGGAPLQSATTAVTVRVRDGTTTITDGPFAETREQLGGFSVLDCKDLGEAITYASRIPHALRGSIEIRPVMEMG